MFQEAWRAVVHGVARSQTRLNGTDTDCESFCSSSVENAIGSLIGNSLNM